MSPNPPKLEDIRAFQLLRDGTSTHPPYIVGLLNKIKKAKPILSEAENVQIAEILEAKVARKRAVLERAADRAKPKLQAQIAKLEGLANQYKNPERAETISTANKFLNSQAKSNFLLVLLKAVEGQIENLSPELLEAVYEKIDERIGVVGDEKLQAKLRGYKERFKARIAKTEIINLEESDMVFEPPPLYDVLWRINKPIPYTLRPNVLQGVNKISAGIASFKRRSLGFAQAFLNWSIEALGSIVEICNKPIQFPIFSKNESPAEETTPSDTPAPDNFMSCSVKDLVEGKGDANQFGTKLGFVLPCEVDDGMVQADETTGAIVSCVKPNKKTKQDKTGQWVTVKIPGNHHARRQGQRIVVYEQLPNGVNKQKAIIELTLVQPVKTVIGEDGNPVMLDCGVRTKTESAGEPYVTLKMTQIVPIKKPSPEQKYRGITTVQKPLFELSLGDAEGLKTAQNKFINTLGADDGEVAAQVIYNITQATSKNPEKLHALLKDYGATREKIVPAGVQLNPLPPKEVNKVRAGGVALACSLGCEVY